MTPAEEMLALELWLLHTDHRTDPAALELRLAPGFEEVAASGHRADRASVLAWLLDKYPALRWELNELTVSDAGDGLRLVRYHARQVVPERPQSKGAWHSSFWKRDASGHWQLWFHQATRLP
jgi:hypothetical protein